MSDTTTKAAAEKKADRLQHVVVERHSASEGITDVLVFGTELTALRHIVGKIGWHYVAVRHGESVVQAMKATP